MAVTKKTNRAALDIFILLILFHAPAFGISLYRIAAGALRLDSQDIAHATAKKASRIFGRKAIMTIGLRKKKVTELLPALESHLLGPASYLLNGKGDVLVRHDRRARRMGRTPPATARSLRFYEMVSSAADSGEALESDEAEALVLLSA
jgi:hypothetical protein